MKWADEEQALLLMVEHVDKAWRTGPGAVSGKLESIPSPPGRAADGFWRTLARVFGRAE